MGNYLKFVADRSQGKPVAVQPRVPSLFEPPAAAISARLMPFPIKSEPELPAQEHPDPITARSQEPKQLASVVPYREQQAPRDPIRDVVVRREQAEPKAEISIPLRQPSVVQVSAAPPPREIQSVTVQTQKPLTPEAKIKSKSLEEGSREDTADGLKPGRRKAVQEKEQGAEPARFTVSTKKFEPQVLPVREQAHPQARQSVAPALVQHQTQKSASVVAEPVEDLRPVVNVTIGRVSVNAITERAPAPPRILQPSGPSMSLDQYLKQRQGRS